MMIMMMMMVMMMVKVMCKKQVDGKDDDLTKMTSLILRMLRILAIITS